MAPEGGAASCRHRAEREGEPRMGLTARGEPDPQKGDMRGGLGQLRKRCALLSNSRPPHSEAGGLLRSVAAVGAPITVPARRKAALHHSAVKVARPRRGAKGRSARSAGATTRPAGESGAPNENMAGAIPPPRLSDEGYQIIARGVGIGVGAGMAGTAAAVHLARGDARKADMRALGAPDGTVAVPHRDGGAGEGLACRNDRGEQEEAEHGAFVAQRNLRFKHKGDSAAPNLPRVARSQEGALGLPAAGRRARGPGGQPPPGKECKPSALRGPRQRADPGAACRRQSTPSSAALNPAAQIRDRQLLWQMTCRGSPQRPQGPFNRTYRPVPATELVTVLACASDDRSRWSAMHSSQSGVPSILRTSASTRSAMVGLLVIALRYRCNRQKGNEALANCQRPSKFDLETRLLQSRKARSLRTS